MTLFGAITAALLRKVQAFLAEVKALVAEVTAVEHKLVAEAEAEIESDGMLASGAELGINRDHSGIFAIDGAPGLVGIGTPVVATGNAKGQFKARSGSARHRSCNY